MRHMFRFAISVTVLAILLTLNISIAAPDLDLQRVFPEQRFERPLLMLQHSDDDRHWYVLEQRGVVYRIGGEGRTTLVDLTQFYRLSTCGECGLLGMAFHPKFATNGYIYLSFTEKTAAGMVSFVARFKSNDNGVSLMRDKNAGEALLRKNIIQVKQPYSNHNGGHIAFGPDGFLYFGLGDGGAANDPPGHGQNTKTLLGSMLRLTDEGLPAPGNRFVKGGRAEIFAYGLRNPWRWSFDRKTGRLWAGDVGQNRYEEINILENGGNFGWRCYEGLHRTRNRCSLESKKFIKPVAEYDHSEGISVTGGYVYRGKRIAALQGVYLFGDYGSGRIWGLSLSTAGAYKRSLLMTNGLNIASFAEGNDGELYVVDYRGGLYAIRGKAKSPLH